MESQLPNVGQSFSVEDNFRFRHGASRRALSKSRAAVMLSALIASRLAHGMVDGLMVGGNGKAAKQGMGIIDH